MVYVDAVAESGKNPVSKHQISLCVDNERADAGRTAEPVSRDQMPRRERGQGKKHISCLPDLEQD